MKKKLFSLVIPQETLDRLRELAEAHDRSIAGIIRNGIKREIKHLTENNYASE